MTEPSKTKRYHMYWPMGSALVTIVFVVWYFPPVVQIVGLIPVALFLIYLYIFLECKWCPICQIAIDRKEAKFCHACGCPVPEELISPWRG